MIVTNSGRPVDRFPLFRLADGEGKYLCLLTRVDVSDVGNEPKAEAFYEPLLAFSNADQMTTVEIGRKVIVFISSRKVDWYVRKPEPDTETE
jgi:hypothetical protein